MTHRQSYIMKVCLSSSTSDSSDELLFAVVALNRYHAQLKDYWHRFYILSV